MMTGYIFSNQKPLFGHCDIIGFGNPDFHVSEIEKDLANEIIKKNHYSGKVYNATYIHLGVFICSDLVGVLQYGYAMNPASCGSVVSGTEMDEYLELNRMWIDDIAPRNSESKALSFSIRYIKRKFPKIQWVQSFADERCGGFGIVYQAASFSYYGEHTSIFWSLDGDVYHNSLMTRNPNLSKSARYLQENAYRATSSSFRQFRYIKFIKKSAKQKCKLKERKYPKHYET